MIFPVLDFESIAQVGDTVVFDASKSHVTPDEGAISSIEIDPGPGFIDVTASEGVLQWVFSLEQNNTISVRITTSGNSETKTFTIQSFDAATEMLFSGDEDLKVLEPEIMCHLPQGKTSFINVHRAAQKTILRLLTERKYQTECLNNNASERVAIAASEIFDREDVREWSKYMTLRMIFEGLSNQEDDIYERKSDDYRAAERNAMDRAMVAYDKDGDGKIERVDTVKTTRLVMK